MSDTKLDTRCQWYQLFDDVQILCDDADTTYDPLWQQHRCTMHHGQA